jgi:hypothetical protein
MGCEVTQTLVSPATMREPARGGLQPPAVPRRDKQGVLQVVGERDDHERHELDRTRT